MDGFKTAACAEEADHRLDVVAAGLAQLVPGQSSMTLRPLAGAPLHRARGCEGKLEVR